MIVALILLFLVLCLKGRRCCFAFAFEWTRFYPTAKFIAGKGYASTWNTKPSRDALLQSLLEDWNAEQAAAKGKKIHLVE